MTKEITDKAPLPEGDIKNRGLVALEEKKEQCNRRGMWTSMVTMGSCVGAAVSLLMGFDPESGIGLADSASIVTKSLGGVALVSFVINLLLIAKSMKLEDKVYDIRKEEYLKKQEARQKQSPSISH